MRAIKVFVAVIMLAISALSSSAMSLEMAQEILNRGKNYLLGDSIHPDSAIICFQKVTETYRPELPLKQREICGTAANNLGFTYYQYLHDYKSAYEYLLKAKEICNNTGRAITKINVCINLGNLYSVFSEQVGSPELEAEAVNSYREAFVTAHEHQMYDLMLYSFCNLTELGQGLKHIDQLTDILDKYATTNIPEGTSLERYAALRYKALRAYHNGDKELSTTYMIKSIDSVDDSVTPYPWQAQAINLTTSLYLERNMTDSAYFYVNKLLENNEFEWSGEVRANAYKFLRKIYTRKGEDDKAREAYSRLLMIQDSMMNVNQLGTIDNLKFIHDLAAERYNSANKLAEADRQKKMRELIIFFIGLLLVIVCPLLIVIINRHRRLQASYRDLYNQRQQIIEQEETNKKLREESLARSSEIDLESNIHPGVLQILAVLDKSEEIYNPDFSLDRLSELTGIRPRTLSGILNDQLHLTFRDLLNQYRVREACKRLSDSDNYGHFTIEAISQSVGYKSRTSLITAFKKETGLTPSEYQRLASHKK